MHATGDTRSMDNGFMEDCIPFYAIECIFRIYLEKNHVDTFVKLNSAACSVYNSLCAPTGPNRELLICEVCLYIFTRACFKL